VRISCGPHTEANELNVHTHMQHCKKGVNTARRKDVREEGNNIEKSVGM